MTFQDQCRDSSTSVESVKRKPPFREASLLAKAVGALAQQSYPTIKIPLVTSAASSVSLKLYPDLLYTDLVYKTRGCVILEKEFNQTNFLNAKLLEAALVGDIRSLSQLLDQGADIHADGDTALKEAAIGGPTKL